MSKLMRDTGLMFERSLRMQLREPVWVFIGLFQPVLYLLLFAPLLDSLSGMDGFGGSALNVFTPGLLVLMALLGPIFAGFWLVNDLRMGVVERLRVTPVSRMAMLLGRVLCDVLVLLVQASILLVIATLMGLRVEPLGVVLMLALIALIGAAMAALSYSIALIVKDEGALASSLNTLAQPLVLLSGIYLPLALAPVLIRTIASVNPLSHAVEAARALFNGTLSDPVVPLAFGLMIGLTGLFAWWAARLFRSATA